MFREKRLTLHSFKYQKLPSKINELRILARETRAGCNCITETWFDESLSISYELIEDVCLSSSIFNERESILLGDLNTNVSGSGMRNLVKSLKSFLDLFNWSQIIKKINQSILFVILYD